MKKTTLSICLGFSLAVFANDTQFLIREMENLRNSLKIDDPKKIELTLRLADLYFDSSITEGNKDEEKAFVESRKKALDLYKQSFANAQIEKNIDEVKSIKILFQMARLHTRLEDFKTAESYYLQILANTNSPLEFKEQSALALAEWYEEEVQYAKALKFYDDALSFCKDLNSCNYANYRKGWLFFKDTKIQEAIAAMEKSLWNKDGSVRENSLTDYILFLSNQDGNGDLEYSKVLQLSQKTNRPELKKQLIEAFYVAGNRNAGSSLLGKYNDEKPSVHNEVRLLEEFYGFRKWEQVEKILSSLEKRSNEQLSVQSDQEKETLAIMRRFLVQVDAESQMSQKLKPTLKRTIDIYLSFYRNDDLRKKMQEGWLASEENNLNKIAKLSAWIKEDTSLGYSSEEIRKLRQTRLSLAQKEKKNELVIEDALAIADYLKSSSDSLEFYYVAAKTFFDLKNTIEAKKYFDTVLSKSQEYGTGFKWAILSQNLKLEILNEQKNYDAIIAQIENWNTNYLLFAKNDKELSEASVEKKAMDKILLEAKFERAAAMGESKVALEEFLSFCQNDLMLEKSCTNAKVLAVKFKNQGALVFALEKLKDEAALIEEYEIMGNFSKAAKMRETKLTPTDKKIEEYIKIALLYELDQNLSERDRVLTSLITHFKTNKKMPAEFEKLLVTTLEDAKMLDEKILGLPWSMSTKIKIATKLDSVSSSQEARKILLSQTESHGPAWSKAILSDLEKDFLKVNSIKFYGSRSQVLFKDRTRNLEKFASKAKTLLDGADFETRIYMLHMLKMAYKNLAQEILNTPIPEGLDEETMANVANQISTLADPFDRVNEDYDRLLVNELAQIQDQGLRDKIASQVNGEIKSYSQFINIEAQRNIASLDNEKVISLKQRLANNPDDQSIILELRDLYKEVSPRISAYYTGRLNENK